MYPNTTQYYYKYNCAVFRQYPALSLLCDQIPAVVWNYYLLKSNQQPCTRKLCKQISIMSFPTFSIIHYNLPSQDHFSFPLFFLSQKQKISDFPSCDSFCTIACKIPTSSSPFPLSKQRFDSKALSSKWFFFVFLPFFFGTQQGLWPFLSIAHVLSFLFLYYYVLWPRCLEISQLLGDTVWPILCQLILFLNC